MPNNNLLALDVGSKRVGVAIATSDVTIARPLTTLDREAEDFWQQIDTVVQAHEIDELVIGLPRGLDGQETGQTQAVRAFAEELSGQLSLPQHWQDEALTSVKARETLDARGGNYQKGDIDALAASYILADYLQEQGTTL
jgi:putative Holliday junction resolvase